MRRHTRHAHGDGHEQHDDDAEDDDVVRMQINEKSSQEIRKRRGHCQTHGPPDRAGQRGVPEHASQDESPWLAEGHPDTKAVPEVIVMATNTPFNRAITSPATRHTYACRPASGAFQHPPRPGRCVDSVERPPDLVDLLQPRTVGADRA